MEHLHAPWRIEYILAPKPQAAAESLFTQIAHANNDEANHVLIRDRSCFALLNTYPYNGGHLLVVPYRQAADLEDLTESELTDLMRLTRRCVRALGSAMKPDGYNVGLNLGRVAGAGVTDHLHIHIVPRWQGDTNFMPVIANTSVMPEALKDVAARLRAALATDGAPVAPTAVPATPGLA
ncbi:MAG: HIT domain-containing protein [Verrucomicrobia bacterium]|nr:HIT domain-containing protein [Verrucomicrobiota bacterium]